MDYVLDWRLIHRDEAKMDELYRASKFGKPCSRILFEDEALSGKHDLVGGGPTAVALYSNELSRARGGPRCMTMPLERDPL